jgi:ribosomal-protein-alanine N-acetyltransferase
MTIAETPRLRLRLLTVQDASFILELLTDAAFLANVGDRGVRDLAGATRYIEEGPAASYTRFGFGLYLVEHKDSARPLGLCGLLRRDSHPDVEIGFAMLPSGRGQGFASEAAAATMRLAIGHCALMRIVAITAPDNKGSIRILERLGFRFERMVHYTADGGESRLFVFDSPRAASAVS